MKTTNNPQLYTLKELIFAGTNFRGRKKIEKIAFRRNLFSRFLLFRIFRGNYFSRFDQESDEKDVFVQVSLNFPLIQ